LPCFGGGILENGTETQKQEQYRPQANDVRWKRRSLRLLIEIALFHHRVVTKK